MSSQSSQTGLEIAQSNQDLIITKGKKKRRAWITAGIVGVIVFAVLIAAILLLKGEENGDISSELVHTPALTLEDFLEQKFYPRPSNATWISDTELIYRDMTGGIVIYDVEKRNTMELLSGDTPILSTAFEFELSPDRQFMLIAHDYKKVFRYSYEAQYTILNLKTRATSRLTALGDPILRFAFWAPVGNAVAFVAKFDVFYRPSAEREEVVAITRDGQAGHIYNGVTDWVYEEEVFSSNRVVWFSPDGRRLAYAKFNDTRVPVMTIPVYGQPGDFRFQYPGAIQIRYPKPGTRNPLATLYAVDLENGTSHMHMAPPSDLEHESILAAVTWANSDILSAIWMNRIQNHAEIVTYVANETYPKPETIKAVKEPKGWLELFKPPLFSKDGSSLLIVMSLHQNDSVGSYMHIAQMSRQKDAQVTAITSGAFVVMDILSWNEENGVVYYQATTEKDPGVVHVYSVSLLDKKRRCLSCTARNSASKSSCLYNSAEFSPKGGHYLLSCEGPDVPEIAVYNVSGSKLHVWEDNEELIELVRDKSVPRTKRMTFPLPGGFEAQANVRYSPNMDLSGDVKYPMLVHVYAGPNNHLVDEKFVLDWGSYLAANKSIIYATIDARGSGLKGDKMMFAVYRRFGTVEVQDQVNVTRQIQQALPYVDPARIAIWGWSYGGYVSGMALATDESNVFKCGISVAPVTDWALYDSIYTERYMGLPGENQLGYARAQLLNKFEGMRYKQYYLIHGSQDDNVHYQQSMLWSKVLEEKDILFWQQSYTDEDHSLHKVYPHLYHSLENFLDNCFIGGNKE